MNSGDDEHHVAPAGRGLAWFQQAIRMLDRDPRGLIRIVGAYFLISIIPNLLSTVPVLNVALPILWLLLWPALAAGLMHAIGEADAGRPVMVAQLFEGLRRPGVRGQLLVLGVFVLFEMILMVLSMQRIIGPHFMDIVTQVMNNKLAPDSAVVRAAVQAAAVPILKALLVAMVIGMFLLVGLFFAIPRVMFEGKAGLLAIFESMWVCAANVLPLFVYALLLGVASFAVFIGLTIVLAILGLLGPIGALLFVPVFFSVFVICLLVNYSGNYLAWREVFGRAGSNPQTPMAGIIV